MNSKIIESIYYLGPEGTYTNQALELFISNEKLKYSKTEPLKTIKAVLKAVDEEKNAYGVVPIENSIEGIVRETIDNLIRLKNDDVRVISEVALSISHALMSKAKDKSKIKTIISHPQAIGQCREYLDKNFPDVKIIEETSTAEAAKKAAEFGESAAAIANEMAARIFKLNIIDKDINDEKDNKTRFFLIGKAVTLPSQADKTSIVFSTKNIAGALAKVLTVFQKHSINLTYIDSRPSKRKLGDYNFFVDVEGHILDKNINSAIKEIRPLISFYRFNGSYKKIETK